MGRAEGVNSIRGDTCQRPREKNRPCRGGPGYGTEPPRNIASILTTREGGVNGSINPGSKGDLSRGGETTFEEVSPKL